ncbi:MAG: adenine deaminase [Gemmatimonadetes bacterium]|nr:MAG: adenine deaminase [Gemmatimonadota bacterium]
MDAMAERLAVARGDRPADVVLAGGRVANVFTGELIEADVALAGEVVAGVGSDLEGERVVDVTGAVVAPGLIDAHVHIESSMVTPYEFARAVVPRGTTTVVTDPHEIANVHGLEGIRYMLDASEGLGLTVFVMASSCVPATDMGTAGARLDAEALATLLDHPRVLGLAEVMNFPGAILGDAEVHAKLTAFRGRPVDGHAPGVAGRWLDAYTLAGAESDHECTTAEEAMERLRRGMWVFFREATNARNLDALLPVLDAHTAQRVCLCTDDRQPPDLLDEGGIDAMVRRVVAHGHDPVAALRLATLNPALRFGLADRGAVAPGRRADLVVLDDLASFTVREVWAGGRPVAMDGAPILGPPPTVRPPTPVMTVDAGALDLTLPDRGGAARVIRVLPDQIVTGHEVERPTVRDGLVVADPGRDLLRVVVVERHTGSGRVGQGLVRGFGLERGALAGTVAHDHHNVIAVGVDETSLRTAIARVAALGGGLVVAEGERVRAELPLPVGGLMSLRPVEAVADELRALLRAAAALGSRLHDPFMAMSFVGLEVIPALKITDRGLVDVEAFRPVDLWVDATGAGGGP